MGSPVFMAQKGVKILMRYINIGNKHGFNSRVNVGENSVVVVAAAATATARAAAAATATAAAAALIITVTSCLHCVITAAFQIIINFAKKLTQSYYGLRNKVL